MARKKVCTPFLTLESLRMHPEISACFNFMLPQELSIVSSDDSTPLQKAHVNFCAKTRLYRALFGILLLLVGAFFVFRPSSIFLNNVVSENYLRDKGWKRSYEAEERTRVIQREMERIQAELDRADTEQDSTVDRKMLTATMKLLGSLVIGPGAMYALDTAAGMIGDPHPREKEKRQTSEVEIDAGMQQVDLLKQELDKQEREHAADLQRLGTPSHAVLLPLIVYGALLMALGGWSLSGIWNTHYATSVSYSLLALCICSSQLLALGMAGLVLPAAEEAEGVTINQDFVQWLAVFSGVVGLAWFATYFEAKSISGFEQSNSGNTV